MVKSGRTHWMDAVPVTLGQEFGGYAAQVREGIARVRDTLPRLGKVPLGGTATGTGLNTHPEFASRVRARLQEETGLEIFPPADPFESQAARDAIVEVSGALKVVAVSLTKIANDIRFMGSGPRAGLAEIALPELQKGSSIMPGKVNPVIPEVVTQVGAQVIGNDQAITVGGLQGHFELNVFVPLLARNLLDSIKLLASASRLFAEKCVEGIEANRETCARYARADALGRDRAQPVHRLRQGERDRQGGGELGPLAARGRPRGGSRRGDARRGARLPQDGEAARLNRPLRFPRSSDGDRPVPCRRLENGEAAHTSPCSACRRACTYRICLRRRQSLRAHRGPVLSSDHPGADARCRRLGRRRRGRRPEPDRRPRRRSALDKLHRAAEGQPRRHDLLPGLGAHREPRLGRARTRWARPGRRPGRRRPRRLRRRPVARPSLLPRRHQSRGHPPVGRRPDERARGVAAHDRRRLDRGRGARHRACRRTTASCAACSIPRSAATSSRATT